MRTERLQAPAEDAGEPGPVEPLGRVGQAASGLHAESEAGRRRGRPVHERALRRSPIEAAFELDPVETLRVAGEHSRAGERGGIELSLPARVAEAGRPGVKQRTATLPRITRSCTSPRAASPSRAGPTATVTTL